MSSYLGIEPTERADYFFASYCNEDAERLTPLVKALAHNNVPLWYDYGLTYGNQWQTEIADRIQGCQAVLLFISRTLFGKPQSYVTTEYEMATEYFDKTVYAVHIDDISKADIPNAYLGWWINLTQSQSLIVSQYPSEERLMDEFARMLKISNHQERISTTMEQYQRLLTIGGLVDASDGALLYDKNNDLLYVLYYSYPNVPSNSDEADNRYLSVCVIEHPATQAVCRVYRHPRL